MSALGEPPSAPAIAQPISPSERLLFSSNHWQALLGVPLPLTLRYSFSSHGGDAPGYDDEVTATVTHMHADATAVVALHFLSGPRQRDLPPLQHAEGNPVLLAFLEHDVADMARLTGGQAGYFRRRIRLALANSAQLQPCTFTYRGKVMQGQEIRVQPYLDDPQRARYARYADKRYDFIVSAQLDGGVFQIHTVTSATATGATSPAGTATATATAQAAAQAAAAPVAPLEETLTLLSAGR